MEKLQDPFLAERIRKGGARSTCGFVDRPARSAAATMDDYSEIFGGFASSCSIPVLVLPEAMDGYGEALLQSHSMNYLEIFGDLDAGTFPVYHEQLLSVGKGSKEGDDRFEEVPNGSLFEKGVFEMHLDVPTRDHIKISKVNKKSSTFHSSLNTEQLNISSRTGQKGIIDEVNSTICSSGLQANCGPDLEADTASSTGIVEDDENPKTIESDDHILNGSMEEEEEKRGKKEEFLSTCYVGSPVHGSENDFKLSKYSSLESKAEDLKQHSRSSSYHSTSSGDVPFSDYSFLTISDINLHTQPLQVPPPSRAPPKLDMKQEMPKSEEIEASNTTFSDELIPDTYKVYHGHHVGIPRTRHALKETTKSNSPIYLNVEVDASSAAAASAAAIVEAMEQAQASLKSAKELMERNRESPQSGRKDSHCFGSWNEQNISFAGRLRYRTPKLAQKVVLNQVERADPIFSEHAEGAIHGKESKFSLLSDERERFHEWKIDKQFYELVGSEKLMRTRVINGEKYTRDEATPNAYPFFPHKETYGAHTKMNSHSDNDNKMEMLHKYKSEKKLYPGGELEVQDRNAENLKFGNTVENEEILDILETSDIQSVNGDDEDKQKIGTVTQVLDESEIKAEGGISLIKHNRNVKELKASQESRIYEAGEKNEDDNKEINSRGRNDSGLMDFYSDSKLEGFDSEAVGKTLGHGKEFDEILGTSITSDHDALTSNEHMVHTSNVFNYNATSEFKKFLVKLSSLENANEEGVEKECRKSFSSGKEKNLDEMREEGQLGKLNKTIRETVVVGYNDGKYSELKDIVDTSEKEVNGKFSETNKSNEFEKNERKLKHEQNTKLNAPNRSEAKVGKASVRPDFLANAKDEFKLQQNEEEKKQYELPPKFVNFVDKLTDDDEKRKGDRHLVGKVQAAFELEKKIRRLSTDQQGLQRIRVQDAEAVQQAKSLSASVNASGSSLKQMEKSIPDEWRDANYISKELSDRERKEAEQKRKLDEERDREREKDRIAVEKTSESCEKIFPESRERPLRSEKSAEVFERFEKVPDEAKLLAERAAVERATAEARERAIEKALAEQASLGARRQAETLTNVSKEKNMKHNTSEGIVRPGEDCENVYDAPADANSQSAGLKEESPLRCKARKERHQRMVERAAKALAEKNMRDLLAQKEQAERNRLAESLDAEVKRWSNGKEGNLRALLSTLQYILGHDSGWQPIPLTDVITAAAVRKAYRKATLYVHPDKLQQRGAIIQHKYICEKVFDLLKDAWNRFNSEGR